MACASALKVSVAAETERHLIWRESEIRANDNELTPSELGSIAIPLQTLANIKSIGITEAITENGRVNFIMPNTVGTVVLQFAALVVTPTVQEPTGKTSGEGETDNIEAVRPPSIIP